MISNCQRLKLVIILSSVFYLSVIPLFCWAGWSDHVGVAIQKSSALKIGHNDRGLRRLIRINGTTIALADGAGDTSGNEGVYRSTDNGANWDLIASQKYGNRGTVITGPDEMVYIFWIIPKINPGIYLTKFKYDEIPPPAERIYSGYVKSVGYFGGYQDLSAAVDSKGNIFLVAHYAPSNGEVDRIWLINSFDGGRTWSPPKVVAHKIDTSFAYPTLEIDHGDNLILCFSQHSPVYLGGKEDQDKRIYYMKSMDRGDSWKAMVQVDSRGGPFKVYNPCLVEDQQNNLYVFAQRAWEGLVMAKSSDGGKIWSGFQSIFKTSNYADPSAAIGADGTIYVTFRCDNLCGKEEPSLWRNTVIASSDHGVTWTLADVNCNQYFRAGPAGSFRYANWWNYGGPLEWTWQQVLTPGSSIKPVYYDVNTDVKIWNRMRL